MAKRTRSKSTSAAGKRAAADPSLPSPTIGIPIPSAAAAVDAIADGNANVLAAYLTHAVPQPDPEVIRAIVVALVGSGRTGFRLKFERRQKGRPRVDPILRALDDDETFRQVGSKLRARQARRAAGESAYGLLNKAIADVAKLRKTTPRLVRLVYERVQRRRARV